MKGKNRLLFLLIFVVIGVLFFISYQGFGDGHILSYRNIEKGLDLSGGVYIVYEAKEEGETTKTDEETTVAGEETTVASEETTVASEETTVASEETTVASEETTVADTETTTITSEETTGTETTTISEDTTSENSEGTNEDGEKTEESIGESSWAEKMDSAVSMIQARLDRKGWSEANVYKEGNKRIRVEIPGVEDAETAVSEIGQTAKLSFMDEAGNIVARGEDVVNATKSAYTDEMGAQKIVVNLEFNKQGTADFKKATEENIGKPIYITLDDTIISMPIVNVAIPDGKAIIEGGFDVEGAEELASLIRAGSLPFELEILEMNTIGATLGANALKTSILGGGIGIILVLIFMLLFYRASGFASSLALITYILLELILLNGLNITLTLHGIAGIILSIGMAVDANVIIFERIREELSMGRTLKLAINKGFSRAFPAILDSNVTTLIAGGVLYWLGSGPIRGFAQTLMLGIVLSMITALVITKTIMNVMIRAGIKNTKLYGAK